MKAKSFYLSDDHIKQNAIDFIGAVDTLERLKVVVSNVGSKSAQRRGLQWQWYTDIVKSGIGGKYEEDKDSLHRACKWRWAVPILLRDDVNFAAIWPELNKLYKADPEKMKYIVDTFVSTEGDDFNMTEYMENIMHYYLPRGVTLTDPKTRGLEDWLNAN